MHSLNQIKYANARETYRVLKEHDYFYARHMYLNKQSPRMTTEAAAWEWAEKQG